MSQHDLWRYLGGNPGRFRGWRDAVVDRYGGGRLSADHDVFVLDADGHLPRHRAASIG